MRDLDARAQALMRNIDRLADEYLRNVKTLQPEKKKEQMINIQSLFNKAKEYGDDKVQLAIQTYELVSMAWDYGPISCGLGYGPVMNYCGRCNERSV